MTQELQAVRTTVPTVTERFRRQAAITPDAVAVEAHRAVYSYARLAAWVEHLAGRLAEVGPEQVVGVCLRRSPGLVATALAVLGTRSTYLPLDPEVPSARLALMLEDAAPALVVHDESTRHLLDGAVTGRLLAVPHEFEQPGTAGADGVSGYEVGSIAGSADCADSVDSATPAYLMYTSGSTGRPKGVLMSAGALDNLLTWHLGDMSPGPGRRVAQFTAMGFDIWVQEVLTTLVSGATLAIPAADTRRDPARLARWLADRRITDLFCPNLILEAVCEAALDQGLALPHLDHIAQAGEQLTLGDAVQAVYRLRPGRKLYNHYGPTETHAATGAVLPADPALWPAAAPIGRPISNTRIHLLDERMNAVADAAEGEVYVSGAALARGYRGRPGLTAERFVPCPFGEPGERMYRTGDLARRLPDGQLLYLGRADQQLKIRGVRVELGEVDAAIRSRPEVRDVAVVARGTGAGRHLDCYLVAAPDASDVVASVRAALTESLLPEMVPATFTLLAFLPANSNGKVDRSALPMPEAVATEYGEGVGGDGSAVDAGAARNPDVLLARIMAECLEVDVVCEDDDFFALGGHSLTAARLSARIRAELGHDVTISDILSARTLGGLRTVLREREQVFPPVAAVARDRDLPASFAQERLWVLDQFSGPSALYNVPIVLRFRGDLDFEALELAVRDVVERHEVLRSKLLLDSAARLCQHTLPVERAFAGLHTETVPTHELDATLLAAAGRPFELDEDPPFQASLFRAGGGESALLLLVHHSAVDGLSVKPLVKDLGFAYVCRHGGFPPPWRSLRVQYADYAAWQRSEFDAEPHTRERRRQEAHWRVALDGAPEVVSMTTDRPRPEVLSAAGARVPVHFDRELHSAVHAAASRAGCTVFMVAHAALALLLRQRGAGDDVVIGATAAGRLDGALDDLVGLFVNTLALRVDLSGRPTTAEVLARVRQTDLAALGAQELPFDLVVSALNPKRTMSANPVMQVMLAFQTGRPDNPVLPGLATSVELLGLNIAKFDLTFELTELDDPADRGPDGISGHLEYSTDLYDRTTALELVEDLGGLLRVFAHEPGRRIDTLIGSQLET